MTHWGTDRQTPGQIPAAPGRMGGGTMEGQGALAFPQKHDSLHSSSPHRYRVMF